MALELVQTSGYPLGQFDGEDSIYLNVLGGEVATIVDVAITADDQAAGNDGYVASTRPVATTALTSGDRPLCLVDDGITGYGTLFGTVIGGLAGQISDGVGTNNGTKLGPHTAAGSGKLTLWATPGTFAVTLDAVHTDVTVGLVPTNPTLGIGAALYATAAGKLTPATGSRFEDVTVARFLNFEPWKGGSLVTTPIGLASSTKTAMTRALIFFNPNI
jgi:hypothetical protein